MRFFPSVSRELRKSDGSQKKAHNLLEHAADSTEAGAAIARGSGENPDRADVVRRNMQLVIRGFSAGLLRCALVELVASYVDPFAPLQVLLGGMALPPAHLHSLCRLGSTCCSCRPTRVRRVHPLRNRPAVQLAPG